MVISTRPGGKSNRVLKRTRHVHDIWPGLSCKSKSSGRAVGSLVGKMKTIGPGSFTISKFNPPLDEPNLVRSSTTDSTVPPLVVKSMLWGEGTRLRFSKPFTSPIPLLLTLTHFPISCFGSPPPSPLPVLLAGASNMTRCSTSSSHSVLNAMP